MASDHLTLGKPVITPVQTAINLDELDVLMRAYVAGTDGKPEAPDAMAFIRWVEFIRRQHHNIELVLRGELLVRWVDGEAQFGTRMRVM